MVSQFRRAVVTGGAGFLGSRVCRRLLDQGTAVVCLDNFLTGRSALRAVPSDGPRFEVRFCDVAEPFEVAGPVDLVLHLASTASPAEYARYRLRTLESGSFGTRNALDLAARKGARFVLASTPSLDEVKRYAEALTAAYQRAGHADTAIARIFSSYGPGMRPGDRRMVPTFACQALRGEPVTVTGDGTQTRSLCHADDTVRGLLLLAGSDLHGPVDIANPEEATVRQFAARIIGLAGSASPIRYVPRPPDDPMSRRPDLTLARTALGFEARVGWQQGLTETITWFRHVIEGAAGPPRAPRAQRPARVPMRQAGWAARAGGAG